MMTRARSLQLGLSALLVAGVVACGTPGWGAAGSVLAAQITTTVDAATTTTEAAWTLPSDARPGDTVTLSLPDHAGGVLADGRWLSASGALIGHVALAGDGILSILLTDAAADPANRSGHAIITTVDSTTAGTTASTDLTVVGALPPGDVPAEFHGVVDRGQAVKYGAWVPGEPRVEWTVETPRGPWDVMTVADPAPAGAVVDCTAGVTVRSTTRTAPDTGFLVDLVPVAPERVVTTCDISGVTVSVTPVSTDEILEVRFTSDVPSTTEEAVNTARVTASRTTAPVLDRVTILRPGLAPVETPTPTPTPTPTDTPTPTHTPTTPRLATTGGDDAGIGAMAAAGVLALIAGAAAMGGARRRTDRGGDTA